MNAINQRIKEIMNYKGLTENSFCKIINIPQTTINSIFLRDSDFKASTIADILNSFSDISSEWLIKGIGEMVENVEQSETEITISGEVWETIKKKDDIILSQQNTIAMLAETNKKIVVQMGDASCAGAGMSEVG